MGGIGGEGGAPPFECVAIDGFFGQVDPAGMLPDGGVPLFGRWPANYDSNLDQAIAAAPAGDGEVVETSVRVTGATVTATDFRGMGVAVPRSQSRFWLGDGVAASETYLDFNDVAGLPPFDVRVGQRISFTVTRMGRFGEFAQIQAATDWILESEGAQVSILEPQAPPAVADVNRIVRVAGTLAGAPVACGGMSRCFQLQSVDGGWTVTFRTASMFVEPGDCVTYTGPLRSFNGQPQLDTINFGWYYRLDP